MTDTPETETAILTLTPVAAAKVCELIVERDLPDLALRVFVQGGGCSGLAYGMAFEETIYPQDRVVEAEGVRLVIDPTSLMYLAGSEIDFVDSMMGGGFAINNPNAISSCGCGKSFRTEDQQDDSYANAPGSECNCS